MGSKYWSNDLNIQIITLLPEVCMHLHSLYFKSSFLGLRKISPPQRLPWPQPQCVILPPGFGRPGTPYCGRPNTPACTPGSRGGHCSGGHTDGVDESRSLRLWSFSFQINLSVIHIISTTKIKLVAYGCLQVIELIPPGMVQRGQRSSVAPGVVRRVELQIRGFYRLVQHQGEARPTSC